MGKCDPEVIVIRPDDFDPVLVMFSQSLPYPSLPGFDNPVGVRRPSD